jgi:hypothetical protein
VQGQQTQVGLVQMENIPADLQMVVSQIAIGIQMPSSEKVHDTVVCEGNFRMTG